MKISTLLAIAAAAAVSAAPLAPRADEVAEPDKYLIKLSETEEKWVTDEERWELRRVRILFKKLCKGSKCGIPFESLPHFMS